MKTINWIYPLTAFLVMILFSQASNAIIITSYTALYEDGSKLVVDLKGYDYGKGSYSASPIYWNEPPFPPLESFDTFFYPSWTIQNIAPELGPGRIGGLGDRLNLEVDTNYGVSMTSFEYIFFGISSSINDNGVYLYETYSTPFSGGYFKTYVSPYQIYEPRSLALMIIGIVGLVWARQYRKT